MNKIAILLVTAIVISSISISAVAHPGRTDSKGGHYCRTNCESWGLEDGEYHYHNGGTSPTVTATTPNPTVTATTPSPTVTATTPSPTVTATINSIDRYVTVEKVVDGDTIWVDNEERVRLAGIDTPEIGDPGAIEAKNYVINRTLNKRVYLDVDNKKQKDVYGRTLAAIFIGGDNINKELLCKGYADVMYIPPSEFNPNDWKSSCADNYAVTSITPEHTNIAVISPKYTEIIDNNITKDTKGLPVHTYEPSRPGILPKMDELMANIMRYIQHLRDTI